ncbi:MAG: hypothetical protein Fur0017_06370 [Anaerolineales bacterium]
MAAVAAADDYDDGGEEQDEARVFLDEHEFSPWRLGLVNKLHLYHRWGWDSPI